jgi:hypothetical protein
MSKVDAMRALKQARLEQLRAAAPARAVAPRPAAARTAPTSTAAAPARAVAAEGACGHRNMSGRSCTRASGHSEKSHRYG